ncbi:MAG: exosome component 10-like [Trebouxia sp. A1-2]|nr:MAG: exosome component 10-like [Trebouxia sp. A1-2]
MTTEGVQNRLLQLQRAVAKASTARLPSEGDFYGASTDLEEAFQDKDDAFECVTALLDDTLEQADAAVETAKKALKQGDIAATGQVDKVSGASTVAGEPAHAKKHTGSPKDARSFFAQQPQDRFQDAVDNSNSPFVHNFEHGLDYTLPAQQTVKQSKLDAHAQKLNPGALATPPSPQHPLGPLLADLHYTPDQLQLTPPQAPRELEETPLTFVETLQALQSMVQHLAVAKEVAVDLEHHHYRSFQGFTCLMQLSTRQEDFIVDTLALRANLGAALTPIFADPKIVKVLHGADKDIQWLQRDFGIYMANMFDTGQASRVLDYSGHGLGYLLHHCCQVKTDKKYQLADWRVRPLPEELMLYARMDTHYLLYIYDRLKAELITLGTKVPAAMTVALPLNTPLGALGVTLERSKQLCLQMYEKELFTETSHEHAMGQLVCTPEQLAVFAGLYAWRDRIARAEDESTGYVLSRNLLQKLAMQMPTSASKVKSFCNTRSAPLVLKHSTEVGQVIAASKQQAHLFARKLPSFTAAAHDSKTDLPAQAAGTTSQGVAAVEPASSSQQQEEAQVEMPQATAISVLSPSPAVQSPAVAVPSPAVSAAVANPIKPRVLKPITMARGSSAILGQPRRPALAQPSSLVQAATTWGEAVKAADAMVQSAPTFEPLQTRDSVPAADHASAGSVSETTTGASAAAPAATSAAWSSVVAAEKPAVSGSLSQKPSAMGSAFSRVMPQIRVASSTMFGNMPTIAPDPIPKGPQAQTTQPDRAGLFPTPDLAAVDRLRAQFTLPFAMAPAEGQPPSATVGKRPQPERQQPTDQDTPGKESATTGEGIRAVVDALQVETPSEATDAQQNIKRHKGSDEDAWHNQDFLPLPMSESYKLPSRKKRSQPEHPQHRQNMLSHDKPGRWAHDKHDQDDPGDHPAGSAANPDLRGRSGHVERAMKDTGLDSSASEEEEEQSPEEQQARKKRKNGSSSSGQQPAHQKQRSPSGNPFGALLRQKDQDLIQGNHARDSSEATAASCDAPDYEGTGHAEIQPFDYAAARAQAPGLELGLNGAHSGGGRKGRGRGRGGRDSGGRGRGRGGQKEEAKPSPAGAFNPYGVTDEHWLKAGKRSAVNPRSGNRSQTFSGQ